MKSRQRGDRKTPIIAGIAAGTVILFLGMFLAVKHVGSPWVRTGCAAPVWILLWRHVVFGAIAGGSCEALAVERCIRA